MKISSQNKYTLMQKDFYFQVKDPIYGAEERHNNFIGNKYLFEGLETKDRLALDFGCGRGRCVNLFKDRFKRIDGADINSEYIQYCKDNFTKSRFYLTDGTSLKGIGSNKYDFVFSTVTLQHIPVWYIRFNLLNEFYRVLKPDGWITIQMGYGYREGARNYYEDYWEAQGTNSRCDVGVDEFRQVKTDLDRVGFKDFKYWITETGPDDVHEKWIYFRGKK